MNDLICQKCGGKELEAFAQCGSYVLRCAHCWAEIVATSFKSIVEDDNRSLRVFKSGKSGILPWSRGPFPWDRTREILVLEGQTTAIAKDVLALSAKGDWLRLDWSENMRAQPPAAGYGSQARRT
jgi:hypothetical protein